MRAPKTGDIVQVVNVQRLDYYVWDEFTRENYSDAITRRNRILLGRKGVVLEQYINAEDLTCWILVDFTDSGIGKPTMISAYEVVVDTPAEVVQELMDIIDPPHAENTGKLIKQLMQKDDLVLVVETGKTAKIVAVVEHRGSTYYMIEVEGEMYHFIPPHSLIPFTKPIEFKPEVSTILIDWLDSLKTI